MIRVAGPGGPGASGAARGPQGPKGAEGAFRLADARGAAGAGAAAPPASAAALGALIALQSETEGRRRNRAAAERALLLLERLRDGLLAGRIERADLERLADAASAKLDDPDPGLAALWADIELRARVELAKFRL
jgi:hypothetical protein